MRVLGIGLAVVVLLALAAGGWIYWTWRDLAPVESDEVVIADVGSERLTPSGSIVGFAGPNDSHAWLGIPYASPPVGDLRWRAPRPAEPWTDTLDALAYPGYCPQLASPLGGVEDEPPGTPTGDEDCLHLNVWAPRFDVADVPAGGERLPVMVWIHGGGNTVGNAGDLYDASLLASTHRVIVVSMNYRLGPFGWFSHPALRATAQTQLDRSANFGILDQIAALRWVRENIDNFGGDPDDITIFGESAGGRNVLTLLVSKPAQGLFARAIVQSGSTRSTTVARATDYADATPPGHPFSGRETVVRLLMADGSAPDRDSARLFAEGLTPPETVEYLRSKTPEEVMAAYADGNERPDIRLPQIIRDDVVVPREGVLAALERVRVPVMIGTNRDESKLFFAYDPKYVSQRFQVLIRVKEPERYDRATRLHSDLWRVRGVDEPLTQLAARPQSEVFAYRFDWDEEPSVLGADLSQILGAGHALELPFVFGHFRLGSSRLAQLLFNSDNWPGRKFVSDAMMSYWAEFAYSGAPGRGRAGALPQWPAWQRGENGEPGQFIIFDTPSAGGIRPSGAFLTRDDLRARLEQDDVLDQDERCRLFFELVRDLDTFDEAEYRSADGGRCRDYPSERYGF